MATERNTLALVKRELFTDDADLEERYPAVMSDRIKRIREMYNYWLSNPSIKDRQLRDAFVSKYKVSQSTAYSDITVVKQLVPLLATYDKKYHLARANEMTMETYEMAKSRKDTRTMVQCISTYGKNNGLDKPDDYVPEYDQIKPQPFCATLDVRVLGIEPIPDIYNYIYKLTKELLNDHADIIDVQAEEPDLEEEHLFKPLTDGTDQPTSQADLL